MFMSKRYIMAVVVLAALAMLGTLALAEGTNSEEFIVVSNELTASGSVPPEIVLLEWHPETETDPWDCSALLDSPVSATFKATNIWDGEVAFHLRIFGPTEDVVKVSLDEVDAQGKKKGTIALTYHEAVDSQGVWISDEITMDTGTWQERYFLVTLEFMKPGEMNFSIHAVQPAPLPAQ